MSEIANIISQLNRQRAAIDRAVTALREVEGAKAAQTASPGEATTKTPPKRRAAEGVTTEKPSPTKNRTAPKKGAPKRATKKAATLPAA